MARYLLLTILGTRASIIIFAELNTLTKVTLNEKQ
jgi:hypothetical protein